MPEESANPKKLLVIAYYFPPVGDVGVHRTLRFIKWLPAFGWEPTVLTTSNGKVQRLDATLLEKIPVDVNVQRCYSFEALNYGASIDGSRPGRWPPVVRRIFCDVPRDVWRYCAVPDVKVSWVPFAVRAGERLLAAHHFDAIYVSGKPFSSYFIGEKLSMRHGIPWFMDMRDLWTLNRRHRTTRPIRSAVERRLERRFVGSAAGVILNTPDNREDFVEHYRQCPADKFVAITNGFDRADFSASPLEKYDRFTIGYGGTFYSSNGKRSSLYQRLLGLESRRGDVFETYSPDFIFEAMRQLFAERPELRDSMQLMMSGPGCDKARAVLDRYGLVENVKLRGWLSYEESVAMLQRTHVNAMVLSRGKESQGWIPSKLYQYLGAGTPVLALVPEGDAAQIVRRTQSGRVVPPDDVGEIKSAIMGMYEQYCVKRTPYTPNQREIEAFEGRSLTAQLASVFNTNFLASINAGKPRLVSTH